MIKLVLKSSFYLSILFFSLSIQAAPHSLDYLQKAYPNQIESVNTRYIKFKDGTRIPIQGNLSFLDWFLNSIYQMDSSYGVLSEKELQRQHYESVFRKIYGNSAKSVQENLTTIYWMPNVFGKRYPIKVTTINGVAQKLKKISSELEKLPITYYKYLEHPAGSYYWRQVKGESYLSTHSFGIAIDINAHYSNYWLWDFRKKNHRLSELRYTKLILQNHIPKKIVEIFEKNGFYWGGHWYYYDTMHFEYRPDLLLT